MIFRLNPQKEKWKSFYNFLIYSDYISSQNINTIRLDMKANDKFCKTDPQFSYLWNTFLLLEDKNLNSITYCHEHETNR